AGDDLVLIDGIAHRAHQDRLDDAALADRGGELVELGFREGAARIARIGFDEFDRHAALTALALEHRGFVADIADQRRQSAAEPRLSVFVDHHESLLIVVGWATAHAPQPVSWPCLSRRCPPSAWTAQWWAKALM